MKMEEKNNVSYKFTFLSFFYFISSKYHEKEDKNKDQNGKNFIQKGVFFEKIGSLSI